ncbi:MAG: hypothetical protein JRJ45_14030, partial [Deltaproteobacteria bacterium]|nr:hypothetical protein [Deltaproteobacteria bacterium]
MALTRARSRCYFVWGRFRDAETSAPAYLFHQQGSWKWENVVHSAEERLKSLSDEDMRAELKVLMDKAKGTIRISEMPIDEGKKYSPLPDKKVVLTSRTFSGNIDRQWHISSFTSLVSGHEHGAELADHDTITPPASPESRRVDRSHTHSQKDFEESTIDQEPSSIFSFPRGTKAGTCLHDIFEHLDFMQKDTSVIKKLVSN